MKLDLKKTIHKTASAFYKQVEDMVMAQDDWDTFVFFQREAFSPLVPPLNPPPNIFQF